jgi:hypothetical protein
MTKAKINAILKEQGLGFIKISDGSSMHCGEKCMTDHDGKRMKGIYLSSHSPMDVTSAASDRIRETTNKVLNKLQHLNKVDGRYVVEETSRTITYLYLATERHRTYSWKANLDEGYQTSYLVPYFTKEKK